MEITSENITLLNEETTNQPLTSKPITTDKLYNSDEQIRGYIQYSIYLLPVCVRNDKGNELLLNIPILKNYKPARLIKSLEDAIHKSFPPMSDQEEKQINYFLHFIDNNCKSLLLNHDVKTMTISNLEYLTFEEIYFLQKFLHRIGTIDYDLKKTLSVTIKKY